MWVYNLVGGQTVWSVQQLKTTNSELLNVQIYRPVSIETHSVIRLSMSEKLKNVYWLLTSCGLVKVDVSLKSSEAIIRADGIFHVGDGRSF